MPVKKITAAADVLAVSECKKMALFHDAALPVSLSARKHDSAASRLTVKQETVEDKGVSVSVVGRSSAPPPLQSVHLQHAPLLADHAAISAASTESITNAETRQHTSKRKRR